MNINKYTSSVREHQAQENLKTRRRLANERPPQLNIAPKNAWTSGKSAATLFRNSTLSKDFLNKLRLNDISDLDATAFFYDGTPQI